MARTVATETAVAEVVARRATESDVAVLAVAEAVQGVWATEADLGGVLTGGQRDTILGVCTSGAGVDLVLGVAGAGKTTAIAGVRHAYEQAGYRVVGTSTSGQAAGYDRVVSPELVRLGREIEHLEEGREDLSDQLKVREEWLWSHPEAAHRLESLDHEVTRAEQALAPSIVDDLADGLGRHLGSREPNVGLDAGIDIGP